MNEGITISKAAAFVGTTVKAVRHYHKLDLVDEPPRDSSGYRRYRSAEILQLVRVRTLASVGVPLAKMKPLLTDHAQNASVFAEIERRLTDHIEDLTRQRDTLRNLANSDQSLLPDCAITILERSAELGFTPEEIAATRESFVLTKALFPNSFNEYIARIEYALNDDAFIALTKQSWEAMTWESNDPRVEALAIAMADYLLANPTLIDTLKYFDMTDKRHAMISRFGADQTWARLNILFEARLRSRGVSISS